ncbi:hypothetical protein GOBAR_AA32328 [Gossypium barbadense]|uniref:PTC1-like winged helix-turn-helix domain-containing protein n=1 Tax=Gossypium barbadense TaxID=3634 RepID=A0A2P5WB96_GOSBA|nr:hypothetical protein GOBAR_AA32328 [Gossypium barbadense]
MKIALGRQLLLPSSLDDAVAHIRVGSYYEIDHSKLPTKTPEHLKLVRVIMVSKKSKCSVSLRYPSMYSLRAHFSERNRRKVDAKMLPTLDEQYAMESETAGDVLYRRIPPHVIALQRNRWSFWVMGVSSPKGQEIGKNPSPSPAVITSYVNMVIKKGLCWSELISAGMLRWGRRRQRKLHGENFKTQTAKKPKQENDKQITLYKPSKRKEVKNSIERWSVQYNLAEKNMLKIMKEKGAVFGNPILRPALRAEARKLIGDTGLLDHLLKHMAWKVAPGGEERFMRRHNADGAMEYWLESADLMDIRKEAGVQDPYWTPPAGWKLGDNPTQDPVCARELQELREEIAKLRRDMLEAKKTDENLALVITPNASVASQNMVHNATTMLLPLKEKYMDLMKWKANLEGQLGEISKSLCGVEEEMGKLRSKVEAANALVIMGSTTPPLNTDNDKAMLVVSDEEKDGYPEERIPSVTRKRRNPVATTENKAAKIQRLKSGFRICKPQGTFLWPNMALSRQVVARIDDLLAVPTPPSVSSSTTTAPRRSPQPTSTVEPLAERRQTVAIKYLPTSPPPPPEATTETTLINLNEVPGNLHDHGYCGSHSSPCPLTYQRRHHHWTTSTSLPRMMHTKKENETSQWEEQERGYSSHSPCSPRTWLALSAPRSSMNKNPRRV